MKTTNYYFKLLDKDGYPTEKLLEWIETFNPVDITVLLATLESVWKFEDYFKLSGKKTLKLELHTGGWSGNESIVDALQNNVLFWNLYWQKSVRGGHHYFIIKTM